MGYIHSYFAPCNAVFGLNFEPHVVDYWYPVFIRSDYSQAVITEFAQWTAPERFSYAGYTNKIDVFSY
jgi:hypothetical protein